MASSLSGASVSGSSVYSAVTGSVAGRSSRPTSMTTSHGQLLQYPYQLPQVNAQLPPRNAPRLLGSVQPSTGFSDLQHLPLHPAPPPPSHTGILPPSLSPTSALPWQRASIAEAQIGGLVIEELETGQMTPHPPQGMDAYSQTGQMQGIMEEEGQQQQQQLYGGDQQYHQQEHLATSEDSLTELDQDMET